MGFALKLYNYNIEIVYRSRDSIGNADAMSGQVKTKSVRPQEKMMPLLRHPGTSLGGGRCQSAHNEPELAHSKLSCLLSDCHLFMLIVLCLCCHVVTICLTNQSHPGEPEHAQSLFSFYCPLDWDWLYILWPAPAKVDQLFSIILHRRVVLPFVQLTFPLVSLPFDLRSGLVRESGILGLATVQR